MKKLTLPALLAIGLLAAGGVPAAEVEGVTLPESVQLGGETLQLNGAGVRSKFFFDIYVGALYLPESTESAREAMAMPGPKRVLMHFLYSEVSREKLVDAWKEGFDANNPDALRRAIAERLERFNAMFETVREGDVITMDYVPGKGTSVYYNDELKGSVPGDDFARALLRVFIGPNPPDSDLKRGMLEG